jgi:hypothetical protein
LPCAQKGLLEVTDYDILVCEAIQFGMYQLFRGTSSIIFKAESLKMKASGLTETLVPVYQTTRRHIAEHCNLDSQR